MCGLHLVHLSKEYLVEKYLNILGDVEKIATDGDNLLADKQ